MDIYAFPHRNNLVKTSPMIQGKNTEKC